MVSILRPARKKPRQSSSKSTVKGLLDTVEPTIKSGYVNEPIPETAEVIEKYWIKEPFSGVVIAKLPESGGSLEYFVQEITLTEQEQAILDKIIEIVSVEINPSALEKQEDIKLALLDEARRIMRKYVKKFPILLDQHVREKINYYLERDLLGYGPIHTLMNDWRIEDISCDGVNSNIYIWHRRYESVPTSIKFIDRKALDDFIVKLAHKSGKHVSSAFPIVDAMIFGKHRLAASFREEISPKGSTFTIRKFREEPYSIIDLMNLNTVSDSIAAYLWLMMENRASILVIGGTAAGKTTILNAIAGLIKPGYKVVTVEETAEINIPTENWVQFTSRESYGLSGNKVGEVSLFDLVRTSLRYRPDFLIVGEVRGEEAFVLFQAVATGHGGLCLPPWEKVYASIDKEDDLYSMERLYSEVKQSSSKLVTSTHEILIPRKSVEVPSYDPVSKKMIMARVGGISRRFFDGELIRFRTEQGNEATVTEDHPMLVFKEGKIVKVKAKEVNVNDILLSPATIPSKFGNQFCDTNQCRLAGFYLSSGSARGEEIRFRFNNDKRRLAEETVSLLSINLGASSALLHDEDGYEVVTSSKAAFEFFTSTLGYDQVSMRVPKEFFSMPDEGIRELLSAYIASVKASMKGRGQVAISVPNKELCYGLYYLMLKAGHSPQISNLHAESSSDFEIVLSSATYHRLQNSIVVSASGASVLLQKTAMNDEGINITKIITVEHTPYRGYVYDMLNVGETHNFVHGLGIISSNCTIHGESLDTAVKRLTSPPMNVAESYIPLMNVALMLERVVLPKTVAGVPFGRRVTNVWEIEDFAKYVSVFEWSPTEDIFYDYTRRSVMLHRFAYRTGRNFTDMLEEIERRRALLKHLQMNNIRQVKEVYKYITEYYVDREALFRRLGIKVESVTEKSAPPPAEPVVSLSPPLQPEAETETVQISPAAKISELPSLPTEPIRMLQSGSYQILSTLFEAKGPVEEEVLMKTVNMEKREFDSLLSMLLKVGHASKETRGEGAEAKAFITITPDGTRAYSLISRNFAAEGGSKQRQKPQRK